MACANLRVEEKNKGIRCWGVLKMTSSMKIVTLQIGIAWLKQRNIEPGFLTIGFFEFLQQTQQFSSMMLITRSAKGYPFYALTVILRVLS